MTRLSDRDVTSLLELVRGCYSLLDIREFRTGVLGLIREAVPCPLAAYNEIDLQSNRAFALFDPPEAMIFDDPGDLLARVGSSNPLITHYAKTRDGGAYKLSDFLTRAELHETPLWQEALGPLGVEYQMALALPSQPTVVIGITLNDGERDFRERDRLLLNLARPQIAQAYRNAQLQTESRIRLDALDRGLEATGQAAIMLRSDGRIRAASPQARKMLEAAFGRRGVTGTGRLPDDLEAWVQTRRAQSPVESHVPLIVPSGGGRLLVRFVPGRRGDEGDVLLLERGTDPLSGQALRAIGLTGRESEVLRLAALGMSTEEIARDLSISRATTRKHFENIYRKLGVQTRAAAVATAWAGAETQSIVG